MKLNTKILLPILVLYICTMSCSCGHKNENKITDNSIKETNKCLHKH